MALKYPFYLSAPAEEWLSERWDMRDKMQR